MPRVFSIHEYDLKRGTDEAELERAIHDAERRGVLALSGLVRHHFLEGHQRSAAGRVHRGLGIRKPREAWEKLWGTVEAPRLPAEYPKAWRVWESEILAPFLSRHPDTIRFTSAQIHSDGAQCRRFVMPGLDPGIHGNGKARAAVRGLHCCLPIGEMGMSAGTPGVDGS